MNENTRFNENEQKSEKNPLDTKKFGEKFGQQMADSQSTLLDI